jgi:hypothetical protein
VHIVPKNLKLDYEWRLLKRPTALSSLISLIDGENGSILSYMLYGQGLVMFGGQVSQVPVPAAVWLFGSALMGLGGVSRRNKLQRNLSV